MSEDPIPTIDYMSSPPPRDADRRQLFKYLLPGAMTLSIILAAIYIETAYPGGDSRDMAPCLVVVTGPLGLVLGIFAIREAHRPGGGRALRWALYWNTALVLGPGFILWVAVHLNILKHFQP
jgi:hypothetical protein